jgi:hypothetical protein
MSVAHVICLNDSPKAVHFGDDVEKVQRSLREAHIDVYKQHIGSANWDETSYNETHFWHYHTVPLIM